jgi:tyrosinase
VLVRKNQATLTAEEKQRFVTAVLALKASGRWDTYVTIHAANVASAHRGPAFCPWHREFLRLLELDLNAVDPTVTLPYWDWSVDDQPNVSLWAVDLMGGNGRAQDSQVLDGPFAFAGGRWPMPVGSPNFLQRSFQRAIPTLPTADDVAATLALTPFDAAPWNQDSATGFRNALEGWVPFDGLPHMHNRVHVWVGGSMLPMTSPNDPVFFLHHANVDRLWAQWQAAHPDQSYLPVSGAAPGHNLDDPMQPWGGTTTPHSVLDHQDLGYMYDTEATVSPSALASAAFPNVYLRMDGRGMSGYTDPGGGFVNCQGSVGPWEKYVVQPQSDGTVALASAAFPNVYLRMDGRGMSGYTDPGGGFVNCQGSVGPWEKYHLVPQS